MLFFAESFFRKCYGYQLAFLVRVMSFLEGVMVLWLYRLIGQRDQIHDHEYDKLLPHYDI